MIFANIKSVTIPEGKVKQIKSGSTLIWKKMEEIIVEIKNWLSEATDLDRTTIYGGDYNKDGKPDGYQTNTRLSSSSGGPSSATGMCCSGFIPCVEGNILRIKGIKPKLSTASYIMTFNGSNTKVVALSLPQDTVSGVLTWVNSSDSKWVNFKNDILTINLSSTYFGTGFNAIRFSAGVIDENTVVTINQEIAD